MRSRGRAEEHEQEGHDGGESANGVLQWVHAGKASLCHAGPLSQAGKPKVSAATDATWSPMAMDAVAAGEGALSTCTARGECSMTKSSTSMPSAATACARTPAPPGTRSVSWTAGTRR